MFVNKILNKKTGRIFITICEGYREKGKVKQRTIKSIGYVDEYIDKFEDPIAHFKELAKKMTLEKKETERIENIQFKVNENLALNTDNTKNFGYLALSKIYHELELDYFINNRRRYTKAKYNHNSIFKLLVFDRIINPSSKLNSWNDRNRFFDKMDFSVDDVYRSLDFFNENKSSMLSLLNKKMETLYDRDTTLLYYDVTNYYFEIDKEDNLRKKGVSKEHRPDPIVQMGLFMDEKGLPVNYSLFEGNRNDCQTMIPLMQQNKEELGMKNLVFVADKGMMTGNNLGKIILDHNGYIISSSIRKGTADFQEYVLNEEEYTAIGEEGFKFKSRLIPRKIWITSQSTGKKKQVTINEKQIIFYSPKYATKAKNDRQKAVLKAMELTQKATLNSRLANTGARRYVKELSYDTKGELKQDFTGELIFDSQLLEQEERLDGYYAICTNVFGLEEGQKPLKHKCRWEDGNFLVLNKKVNDLDIIEIYRGLWKIEESFKITKSGLKARPVYVSRQTHIETHFLICFVSLLILRILETKLKGKYSAMAIAESLKKANCSYLENGYYLFNYYDEILKDLETEMKIGLGRKYMKLGEIKKALSTTKKND